ncbi:MAG: pyridoxamine 5'-phosphate oxidase family protein [Eubacterium sp.]|nr:pyridoxamine 5'-phosphate oxidase family protein [Eubacterium sp.]
MFREMRRKNQMLSRELCTEILKQGTSGVLAVLGDDAYPYAVPLSYVYADEKLYFHSAVSGHKLDAVKAHSKASFCVIAKDQVVPEKYTTYYQSVIAFGTVRVLDDDQEKMDAIQKLSLKYTPNDPVQRQMAEIERYWNSLCMMELTITHMTGKQAKELVFQPVGN